MEESDRGETPLVPTRIAVYDDLLSAPRVIDIEPTDIARYIEEIASKTYECSHQQGSTIPYTVIKEVCENFIHADFREPCVSILDGGNTIKFTDQGPGIEDKQRAMLPGFTSATSEMRKYIRGVGSGLPTVREYLRFSNGRLIIEDNIKAGTVVTIEVDGTSPQTAPVVYREEPATAKPGAAGFEPTERELDILALAAELGAVGPTEAKDNLGLSLSTAYRDLKELEDEGLLARKDRGAKRALTERGSEILNGRG